MPFNQLFLLTVNFTDNFEGILKHYLLLAEAVYSISKPGWDL